MWYLLFIILFFILLGYVIWSYIKDRREMRKRTIETIGDELWKEIDKERQDSVEKGKQFRRILRRMSEKNKRR